jgi:hypothetical protein
MRNSWKLAAIASSIVLAPAPAHAQAQAQPQRRLERGVDAGAVFGLGSQSSGNISLPGSRLRVGFYRPGSRISLDPAAGFSYDKVEGTDGLFSYNLEMGALYHFQPLEDVAILNGGTATRFAVPYVRPFMGLTGFTGGNSSDTEFSLGAGLGSRIPFRRDLAIRFEGNIGYGFDNKATRIGLLAGLSFFPH